MIYLTLLVTFDEFIEQPVYVILETQWTKLYNPFFYEMLRNSVTNDIKPSLIQLLL